MAEKIFVTEAQVKAAQMLVDRDRALGREPDPATRRIAEARREHSAGSSSGSTGAPRRAAVSFWDALDPAEQEALTSVASMPVYDAGARLMSEGEPADHVIVILGGRAKISVDRDGRERVLAIRGLGELVGERAALQGRVRSATVTALEVVWALVVKSEDFTAFLRDHPRVVGIVQDLLYDRLTEGPVEYDRDEGRLRDGPDDGVAATGRAGDDLTADRPRHRLDVLNGENCTVVLADASGLGAGAPGDSGRLLIREALLTIMATALQGIPDTLTPDRNDGFLAVVPPSTPTAEVMSELLKELPGAIERYNRSKHASPRVQLRLAVNVGPVFGDAIGVAGEAIVVASPLLHAPDFAEASVNSAASLAIIISPFVYETVIKYGPDLNETASYTQVSVEVRGSSTTAWMKVIRSS
jgi:CRP-like cAMP-binding protein